MVGLPNELAQLGTRASAHLAHEVLAEGEHRIGEHRSAVLADNTGCTSRVYTALRPRRTSSSGLARDTGLTVAIGTDRAWVIAERCQCRRLASPV